VRRARAGPDRARAGRGGHQLGLDAGAVEEAPPRSLAGIGMVLARQPGADEWEPIYTSQSYVVL
jgi:hypothetical protein